MIKNMIILSLSFVFIQAQDWLQTFEMPTGALWEIDKTNDDGFIVSGGNGANLAIKLDSLGTLEWEAEIGGSFPKFIEQFDNGSYIALAGQTAFIISENGEIENNYSVGYSYAFDGTIISDESFVGVWSDLATTRFIEANTSGEIIWESVIDNVYRAVDRMTSGDYFLSGYSPTSPEDSSTFMKTDSEGTPIWVKKYNLSEIQEEIYDGIFTSDSAFISVGVCYVDGTSESGADLVVIKLDENGDSLWTKRYGGQYHDYSETIIETFNGNYLIAGYRTQSYNDNDTDAWLLLLDTNGDSLWSNTYYDIQGSGVDKAYSVVQADDGSFVFCGLLNNSPFVAKTEYAEPLIVDPCELGIVYVSEGHTSGDPDDYIEIYNSGDSDCSLEGFQLDNNEELQDFTFGDVVIQAGGYWLGYEDAENSFTSGLSSSGDIIVFANLDNNTLIITLEESQELDGVQLSQSFNEDGEGCYTNPTPGEANSECITLQIDSDISIPNSFTLHQNYPNPFNPRTTLHYNLPEDAMVNITIYDMMGRVVNTLITGSQTAGYKSIQWNGTNNRSEPISAGLYLYTIQAGDYSQTKKMVLLK
jgi:hypothetical protein